MQPGFWEQCLVELQNNFDEQQFNTWVRPLQAITEDKTIKITAPNQYAVDWANENLSEYFLKRLKDSDYSFNFEVGGISQKIDADRHIFQEDKRDSFNDNLKFSSDFTFDNFVTGKSNELARAAALQVSSNPGSTYNPFFIYGGVGLGKTHLMNAIGNNILKQNSNAKILYLHSEKFVADMVRALQHNKIDSFKEFYRSADALLIDDIQFFAGKERSQEEFFHTFNSLLDLNKRVIISADRSPSELSSFDDRMKSRLSGGLVVDIMPTTYELRYSIIKNKYSELREKNKNSIFELDENILEFLAKTITSNIRELEGALNKVFTFSNILGKKIDIELTKSVLKDLLKSSNRRITIDEIQNKVASYFNIKIDDLISSRRIRTFARPRQVAMYLTKKLTTRSLPEIGRKFGGRDHTTVIHAVKKIEELKQNNPKFDEDINLITQMITSV